MIIMAHWRAWGVVFRLHRHLDRNSMRRTMAKLRINLEIHRRQQAAMRTWDAMFVRWLHVVVSMVLGRWLRNMHTYYRIRAAKRKQSLRMMQEAPPSPP